MRILEGESAALLFVVTHEEELLYVWILSMNWRTISSCAPSIFWVNLPCMDGMYNCLCDKYVEMVILRCLHGNHPEIQYSGSNTWCSMVDKKRPASPFLYSFLTGNTEPWDTDNITNPYIQNITIWNPN